MDRVATADTGLPPAVFLGAQAVSPGGADCTVCRWTRFGNLDKHLFLKLDHIRLVLPIISFYDLGKAKKGSLLLNNGKKLALLSACSVSFLCLHRP